MYIGEILRADSANGTGIRLSIFVSGCENHCEGCFQPETWDYNYGKPYTAEMEDFIIEELKKPYYEGVTLLGGDPMEESNQRALLPLLQRIKDELPDKNVWIYTGYVYDRDLVPGGKRYFDGVTGHMLELTDVMVDGPFVMEKKDITLKFRGSKNQRIIDMKNTLKKSEVTDLVL